MSKPAQEETKMNCGKCAAKIAGQDVHEHNGLILCEDCYIDAVAVLKTCDPWAVYTASRTVSKGVSLTDELQLCVDVLKVKGPATLEQICSELGIGEHEFRTRFSTLRHMGLARACKKEEQVWYTL